MKNRYKKMMIYRLILNLTSLFWIFTK